MSRHSELHRSHRIGWLRAGVLGANDGIVSTASLMIGVAASQAGRSSVLVAGLAGLVAGAMAMATGEYVSVSSQRDTENADIARERAEQVSSPESELAELAHIYEGRGLEPVLARTVAGQLMAADPLGAHLRDELGLTEATLARPVQAAVVSAVSFSAGAAVPVLAVLAAPTSVRIPVIAIVALAFLGVTGALGAGAGKAPRGRAVVRVVLGGGLAMTATALIGRLLGAAGV